MGFVDQVTKDYLREGNVFADAFNYLLYEGENVIKPECLSALNTAKLVKKAEGKHLEFIERTRDMLRNVVIQQGTNKTYLILGIESQSYIDYAMPVRNFLMNAIEYAEQVDYIQSINQEGRLTRNSDEYLSGIRKDDKLKPVITLVIYFSHKKWDGARKLSDMLEDMDESTRKHFNDYELDIIEPATMTDEDFDKFHSNLREVLKFLKYSGDKKQMKKLLLEDNNYKKMPRKAAQVINVCAKLNLEVNEEKEEMDMCQAWEEQKEEGRQEGKQEGITVLIRTLIDLNLSKEEIIERTASNFLISREQAEEYYCTIESLKN